MLKVVKKKNVEGILQILGGIIQIIGLFTLVPCIVSIYYNENTLFNFLIPGIFFTIFGFILKKITKPGNLKLHHTMIASALAWLIASFIGAIPLYLSIPYFSYVDAVYESMSAWTTTGMTLIPDVESLPKSILFWRSFQQWIGGVGILVLSALVLARSGTVAYLLYTSEARQERIMPSAIGTIKTIVWIYVLYTILGILLLYLAGLNFWEALNLTMTGICTGGMSISNYSFPYNDFAKIIMIGIMMIGGIISFSIHHRILTGKYFNDIQTKYALVVIAITSIIISIKDKVPIIDSLFTVVSAMTSTGFTTINISNLSNLSLFLIIFLMLIGGGAGTTTGGVKIIRFLVMLKALWYEIKEIIYPKSAVIHEHLDNIDLDYRIIREAFVVFFLYSFSSFLMALTFISLGYSPYEAIFDAISFTSNIGMSLGIVTLKTPIIGKIAGIIAMWIGRLEIIPVLVLFATLYLKIKKIVKSKNL
ncbi:cation transporter [Methanocaldococcus bathoardescens]|uniref:Cation transporter n=1 Tax=Methanocaldococcus bathoardescens TaxID=1301915 RepID=A0A076LDN7_9EURY|nr:TrkH family potassium uptake protein [Methanocaldococcus bathoardescens]AIJ06341.1 cation transporter [Methanocaldococcus bathoardescens]